jgi:hypothetical protein
VGENEKFNNQRKTLTEFGTLLELDAANSFPVISSAVEKSPAPMDL